MDNRNESFMHTAAKLLEKAKQAQQNQNFPSHEKPKSKLILKTAAKVGNTLVQENLQKPAHILNESDAKA